MPVKFFNEDFSYTLQSKKILKLWIENTIRQEGYQQGDINVILTSDKFLLDINKKYLNHNYYTDIITFNYCTDSTINGDIFISIETVKNNSRRFGVLIVEELHRVMIHGILHLLGFDDQNDTQKALMREKENYYLDRLKNLF